MWRLNPPGAADNQAAAEGQSRGDGLPALGRHGASGGGHQAAPTPRATEAAAGRDLNGKHVVTCMKTLVSSWQVHALPLLQSG